MFEHNRRTPITPLVTVIGAGKFGSAIAEMVSSDGTPTTLVTRSHTRLQSLRDRMVRRPRSLQLQSLEHAQLGEFVFLALPSADFPEIVSQLALRRHVSDRRMYISLSKGLTAPDSETPFELLERNFGVEACAIASGPTLADEMAKHPTHLMVASQNQDVSFAVARILSDSSTECATSTDPHGIEFAAIAKNITTLGFYACREATGSLNIAGTYAGKLFEEVYDHATAGCGASPRSFVGIAGVGDLLATSHASSSRNTRAGKLLGDKDNVSASEIEMRIKQVVESLHSVPLLERRINKDDVVAPSIDLLSRRIVGELSRDEWASAIKCLK